MAQKSAKIDTINKILDPLQLQVIELLMAGQTVSEACKRVGLDRSTYYLWAKSDPVFVSEMSRARAELRHSFRIRLAKMTDQAIGVVEELLANAEDPKIRMQAALSILKANGLLEPDKEAVGSIDPEDVARSMAQQRELDILFGQLH